MKNNDINFEYTEDFVDFVIDELNSDDDLFVTVIAKFEEMRDILKDLMLCYDINFEYLELSSPNMTGYTDEFVLSLWNNDGVIEICCEPLKVDGEFTNLCGDAIYLFSNCSSKIIPLCDFTELYFVSVGDDYDCDEECCCECCDCDDENIYGFTVDSETDNGYSKFTYYSSNPVDKTDIRNILRELGF